MAWVERNGRYWRVRYYADDGTVASLSDRYTEERAREIADEIHVDSRRGEFLDPRRGDVTLGEWAADWFAALDVAPATAAQYQSLYRTHIEPRWSRIPVGDIAAMKVRAWERHLGGTCSQTTVGHVMKVLRLMLADAVDERLIPANPARVRRRGKRQHVTKPEKVWASPSQAVAVADAAGGLAGSWARTLILTAAWTGMRWGELAGLAWSNVYLLADRPYLYVHPRYGALHEVAGDLRLGPPKSEAAGRRVTLPPFLVDELALHQATYDGVFVFAGSTGTHLRRSNFARNVLRPVCDGRVPVEATGGRVGRSGLPALAPQVTMHGFRHGHNTWLIEMGLPDVARARRLGWRIPDAVRETYSHVSADVEQRLLDGLEERYRKVSHEASGRGDVGERESRIEPKTTPEDRR